jgi:capsular polysaccharide transport system permease protein
MSAQNITSKSETSAAEAEDESKLAVLRAQRRARARTAAEDSEAAPDKKPLPRRKGAAAKTRPAAVLPPVRPTARKARLQRRHIGLAVSFLLFVVSPVIISSWYLWTRAADQYASYLGFSVRSESGTTSGEVLGGLTSLVGAGGFSSTDTDVLYKFIQSHDLVERVDARLDLRQIWSKAPNDPVFSYTGNDSLEDLLNEWERKVRIYYDNGMIDLRILAFDPKDAQAITQAIYEESTILINQLNDVAREDTLRYSREELEAALDRLKEARQAVTEFRNRHQMVDPSADVQGQVGVVASLQQQLAESLVQLGLLKSNAQASDPRIEQTELRIRVIREQIADERMKFGSETTTGESLSEVVGQYETLAVDREFAERSYTAALATHETARIEASRQSRYLAAYVKPTLAQEAEYPERGKLMMIIGSFLLVIWIIGVLMFYSLRDRR